MNSCASRDTCAVEPSVFSPGQSHQRSPADSVSGSSRESFSKMWSQIRPPNAQACSRETLCSPCMASLFKIQRGTEVLTLNVPVTEHERDPESILDPTQSADNIIPKLGIAAMQITDSVAQLIPPTRSPGGILVTALTAGGNASLFGLQPGDVLHSLNRTSLDSLLTLRTALAGLKPE